MEEPRLFFCFAFVDWGGETERERGYVGMVLDWVCGSGTWHVGCGEKEIVVWGCHAGKGRSSTGKRRGRTLRRELFPFEGILISTSTDGMYYARLRNTKTR